MIRKLIGCHASLRGKHARWPFEHASRGGKHGTLVLCALLLDSAAFAQRELTNIPKPDPAREISEFKLAPGLEINLFASDPDIAKPIQMNWDSRGRLWVASSEVYPQIKPGQEPTDKIIVLEDTDGDGRADKRTVFADGLLIPTGVLPHENGAYVANSTEILYLQDTNNDGKADKITVLLTGFGTEDTHHIIHAFRWGPDGRFYFNQSIYIHSHVETPWGPRELLAGGIWQYRPQTARLEVFAKGFVNSWGHVFDRWGQSLATDGAYGEGINHVFPGAAFVTASDAPRILKGMSPGQPKHCGLEVISGDHFPPDWQGTWVTNDFRGNRINRFALTPSGSSFTARQLPDVVASSNVAFRPIDARMGPDGALYVADWYNPIIQHGEVDFRDPRRDHAHGRIWRITAKGRPLMKPKRLDQADIPTLIETLKSNLDLERLQAKLELRRRPKEQVLPALEKWWKELDPKDAKFEHNRLEAVWTYQTLDCSPAVAGVMDLLMKVLDSGETALAKEPYARAAALRVLSEWFPQLTEPEGAFTRFGVHAAIDRSPIVRLEAVNGLRAIATWPSLTSNADKDAAIRAACFETAMRASEKDVDENIDFALWLTARQTQSSWLAKLQKGEKLFGGDFKKLLFALRAAESPASAPPLVAMLSAGLVPDDQWGPILELVAKLGGQAEIDELWEMAIGMSFKRGRGQQLLNALVTAARDRKLKPSSKLNLVSTYLQEANVRTPELIRLAGLWRVPGVNWTIMNWLKDHTRSGPGREIYSPAFEALAMYDGPEDRAFLANIAMNDVIPAMRADAIVASVPTRMNEAAQWATAFLADHSIDTQDGNLEIVIKSFLQRKGGVDALAAALANKKLSPDRAAMALRIVNASGRDVGKLAATLNRMVGSTGMPAAFSPAERTKLLADVQSFGDPVRGEAVYRREAMQCQKCHAIGGAGGLVGADMVSLGASAQLDYIVESLLEPSKKIKEGYNAVNILKTDGASLVGMVVTKSDRELKLRDANGAEFTIPTADIEQMKPSPISLMPQDLFKSLPRNDFLDLAKFLSQLGKDGPYKVGPEKLVRRFRTLATTRETNGVLMRVGNAALFETRPGLTWKPAYAEVAGTLPIAELQSLPHFNGEVFAAARFELESPAPGKVGLRFTDPSSIKLWLGAEEHSVSKDMSLPLSKGVNVVTLLIDKKRRQSPLKIEVVDLAGGVTGARPVSGQ